MTDTLSISVKLITSKLVAILSLTIIGYWAGKLRLITDEGHSSLSNLVVFITMPALLFTSTVSGVSRDIMFTLIFAPIIGFVNVVTMLFLALFIGYSMRIPQEKIGTFGALCSIPNSAYLGYPIILSILGEKALTYAVIYDTGACLALWTVVISIIRRGARLKANWQQILNPALASVLLALTTNVSGLKLPETILEPIRIMGQATVPLAMTALGYSFLQMKSTVTENHGILITTALVKLILYPLLAYAVLNLFPLDPMFKAVVVIIAAMPSMAGTPIIVEKFGGDLGFATSGVFFTTTLSLLTIPLLLYVLG